MAAAPEKTIILNSSAERLVGILDDTGSKELTIFCHGLKSSKDCDLVVNVSSMLVQSGISVFRFDFSGNGESEGEFQFGNYSKEVEDLHSVVHHWMQQGRVVKAIVGHSKGGTTVLLYASRYHDVHTIINSSGRFDLTDGLKDRLGEDFLEKIEETGFLDVKDKSGETMYCVTKDTLMERLNTDMKTAASKISNDCRVLTVHGSKDDAVPVKNAYECDKFIPNHTLRIIEGADHMYSRHERELADVLIEFIQQEH